MVGLYRDQHLGHPDQGIGGEYPQAGGTIDQHIVPLSPGECLHTALEHGQGGAVPFHGFLGPRQPGRGGHDGHPGHFSGPNQVQQPQLGDYQIGDTPARVADTEPMGGRSLGIHIHYQHPPVILAQRRRQVHGGGGLSAAAFLINYGDRAHYCPAGSRAGWTIPQLSVLISHRSLPPAPKEWVLPAITKPPSVVSCTALPKSRSGPP